MERAREKERETRGRGERRGIKGRKGGRLSLNFLFLSPFCWQIGCQKSNDLLGKGAKKKPLKSLVFYQKGGGGGGGVKDQTC